MASFQVGDEDKKTIAIGFLKNAPPGEFIEVFTDVRKLLGNDTLLNSVAPSTFKEYNTDQYLIAHGDGGFKGLVCSYGEVGNNQYLDPSTRQAFTFDHIKQQITSINSATSPSEGDVESWRSAFQTPALKYVDDYYQENGCAAVYGSKSGGQHVLNFIISSARFNPDNFWNGRWRSTWNITYSPGGQARISGNIKLNVHYYEEGNVQLVSNFDTDLNVNAQNPDQFAKEAVNAISKAEADFQNSLDNNYDTMSSTTFKALRRPLPIFRTLMNWNGLAQYEQATGFHN